MRYLFLLPLALILITSCTSDRESLNGSWSFAEARENNKLIYSTNKSDIDKIINDIIKTEGPTAAAYGKDENMLRQELEASFVEQAKSTWDFNEKDTLTLNSHNAQMGPNPQVKFELDPEKKLLTLKDPNKKEDTKFTYEMDGDKLTLKREKTVIQMVRKGE